MRDLNRWNPEAFAIAVSGPATLAFIFTMASYRSVLGVGIGVGLAVGAGIWFIIYFHRAEKQALAPFLKQKICKHDGGHITSMPGIEDLRSLFSGKITTEQYAKLNGPFVQTECCKCGQKWIRN